MIRALTFLFLLLPHSAFGADCGGPDQPPCECTDTNATKCNDTLFEGEHAPSTGIMPLGENKTPTEILRQSDAFITTVNVAGSCIETNLQGRNDADCAANPNHPECAGLNKALENASNCEEWFNPASLGCKRYGAHGFTMEEWLAFGTEYFEGGIKPCDTHMTRVRTLDSGDPNKNVIEDMKSMTDMVSATQGLTESGGQERGQSGISGSTEKRELEDGSTYLGYENGEILKRARAGDSFLDVITESDFYKKLSFSQKRSAANAVENAEEIAEKTREKKGLLAKDSKQKEEEGRSPAAALADSSLKSKGPRDGETAGYTTVPQQLELSGAVTGAAKATGTGKAENAAITLMTIPTNAFFDVNENARLIEKQRAAALAAEQAARNAKVLEEFSLFERVRMMYQKRAPSLRRMEISETARAVRSTEAPQFFNSL